MAQKTKRKDFPEIPHLPTSQNCYKYPITEIHIIIAELLGSIIWVLLLVGC